MITTAVAVLSTNLPTYKPQDGNSTLRDLVGAAVLQSGSRPR